MRMGKLYEKLETHNSGFVAGLINETLEDVNTMDDVKSRLKNILAEADNYAADNDFKYRYLQMAGEPLWVDVAVEPEHFIYQGFDAYINIDLKEDIDQIKPYILIQNNNVSCLENGQRIEIDDTFKNGLNDLQREIFEEALSLVEAKTTRTLQSVWKYEKRRLDKWIKESEIQLKGTN